MKQLAWIGRQKSKALAACVAVGILLPGLGEYLKPYVSEAVFGLLVLAFLRTDYSDLKPHLRKPFLVIAATLWTILLVPLMIVVICTLTGVQKINPDLFLGITLQAIASPLTAAPAIAMIMGLDATLVLITLVASTALVPLSAPIIVSVFDLDLSLSATAFGLKLFFILTGAALLGAVLRKILGKAMIDTRSDEIDGINIVFLLIFVCAVMSGLGQNILSEPMLVMGLTILAFVVFFVLLLTTTLVFKNAGIEKAFALGMMVSQRNMGLMLAGTSGLVPELTWLYFAVSQFPLYFSPLLLRPIVRRIKNP